MITLWLCSQLKMKQPRMDHLPSPPGDQSVQEPDVSNVTDLDDMMAAQRPAVPLRKHQQTHLGVPLPLSTLCSLTLGRDSWLTFQICFDHPICVGFSLFIHVPFTIHQSAWLPPYHP